VRKKDFLLLAFVWDLPQRVVDGPSSRRRVIREIPAPASAVSEQLFHAPKSRFHQKIHFPNALIQCGFHGVLQERTVNQRRERTPQSSLNSGKLRLGTNDNCSQSKAPNTVCRFLGNFHGAFGPLAKN
jgi:hypothetical protein